MKIIEAKNGEEIMVDGEDFPILSRHKWTVSSEGYARTIFSRTYTLYMHRLIMVPKDKNEYVDHINHNRLDNRKVNLRLATNSENQMNRKKNTRETGVSFHKLSGKWRARITKNQSEKYLGLFETKEAAIKAREVALKNWSNL